jgi:hypothetical protein
MAYNMPVCYSQAAHTNVVEYVYIDVVNDGSAVDRRSLQKHDVCRFLESSEWGPGVQHPWHFVPKEVAGLKEGD